MKTMGQKILVTAMAFVLAILTTIPVSFAGGIYGEPVREMQHGMYDNNTIYWQVRVQGDATDCWVDLDLSSNVNRLSTKLMVDRSVALEVYYDTYTLSNMARNDKYVYTRWQGTTFAAIAARGEGTINTTRVASIRVSGWGVVW